MKIGNLMISKSFIWWAFLRKQIQKFSFEESTQKETKLFGVQNLQLQLLFQVNYHYEQTQKKKENDDNTNWQYSKRVCQTEIQSLKKAGAFLFRKDTSSITIQTSLLRFINREQLISLLSLESMKKYPFTGLITKRKSAFKYQFTIN